MQTISGKEALRGKSRGTCVTVGTFDGVHLGHAEIIRFLKSVADAANLDTLIFTFREHPRFVLQKDADELKILSSPEEKRVLLAGHGIDYLYEQEFSNEFASMPADAFVRDVLIGSLGMKSLVIGHDHLFGRNREGDYALLSKLSHELGFSLHQIPAVSNAGFQISSTKIRNILSSSDIQLANEMLGYHYFFTGEVVSGFGIGKELGFPTANLKTLHPMKMLPAAGVYIIRAIWGDTAYEGLINIGNRPTFNGSSLQSEVHLFDFDQSIYGEQLTIYFLLHLRQEMKFPGRAELVNQIRKDRDRALQYFGRVC